MYVDSQIDGNRSKCKTLAEHAFRITTKTKQTTYATNIKHIYIYIYVVHKILSYQLIEIK